MMEFYFESAAMILTLITVGKMLEARSKGKTTDALKSLMLSLIHICVRLPQWPFSSRPDTLDEESTPRTCSMKARDTGWL